MSAVPARARTAATLFLVYAALMLLNSVVWHVGGGEAGSAGMFRAIVRGGAIVLIAIGLLKGAHWAWLFGVVFAGLWLVLGIIGAVALVASGVGLSLFGAVFLVTAHAVLGTGWGLLLTPEVRQAYRSR